MYRIAWIAGVVAMAVLAGGPWCRCIASPISWESAPVEPPPSEELGDFFEDDGPTPEGDLDDFFEDGQPIPETPPPVPITAPRKSGRISVSGEVSLETGWRFNHDPPGTGQTDHRGLSDFSPGLSLEVTSKLFDRWKFLASASASHNAAYQWNDSSFTQAFLDDNKTQVRLEKAYVQGSLSHALDIKIGRQIVVWGKSDNIRVTDILNPLDLRAPGRTDIEDLRQPIFMTRLDYYVSNLTLSAFLIHEHKAHTRPVFGSPYYFRPFALPDGNTPSDAPANTELAAALNINLHGMDLSFYLAHMFDDTPFLASDHQMRHERYVMAGAAVNRAAGNFLYKAETAFFDDLRLSAWQTRSGLKENPHDYARLDTLIGVEYSGFTDTTVSLEFTDRWLMNHDDDAIRSGADNHTCQYAFRWTRTFKNEIIESSLLASLYGKKADDGGFIRIQGSYDLTDSLCLTLGAVFYASGSLNFLEGIGDNDMLFSSLEYHF